MTDEVTLPPGGIVDVSPVEPQTQTAPKKKRGRPAKTGKWAGLKKGTEEYKQQDRIYAAERRELKQGERDEALRDSTYPTNLYKKDIKRILVEERKLRPHIAEQCVRLVQAAARAHGVFANWFLVRHGLKNTLATIAGTKNDPPTPAEEIMDGEILFKHELECLYDFSMYRQPEVPFDKFLEQRRNCKSDAMYISKLFNKDFAECHRVWTEEFFPQINPSGLQPNYSQHQARKWLQSQSEHYKTFLLLASRNSFKSSWSKFFVLSLVAAYPDVRVVLVSETHELSELFAGELRQYLEVMDESEPNRFLQLFPELAVLAGEGSAMIYGNPVRHLRLPAPTIRSTSVDAAITGGRYDLLIADDILSDRSCGNEKQINSTISRFESFWKLGEVGSSLTFVLGTPWSENPPDLYKTLKDRADADPDTAIRVRIDPIMHIKPHARSKKFTELVEDDIESLLFPERMDWKFIRQEIMKNPKDTSFFESQNMVRFVPPPESLYKCNFDEQTLRDSIVFQTMFNGWVVLRTILSIDTSASASRYADMSCLVTSKLYERPGGERMFVVHDIDMDRYRPADLAEHIALARQKHNPDIITIERCQLWQALEDKIELEANKRNFSIRRQLHWREPGNSTIKGKAARIKNLEPLVNTKRLLFVFASWNETVIQQFLHWDGVRRSGSADFSKDDAPDAIAMGVERVANDLLRRALPPKSDQQFEAEAQEMGRQMLAAQHDWMFGSPTQYIPPASEPEPPSAQERYWGKLVRR
jgi:hypothetical protein